MVVCWRYAEARAFEPFKDEPLPEGKEPNELRIGLFQATGLAVKEKGKRKKQKKSGTSANIKTSTIRSNLGRVISKWP